jgi:hypothetical protein
MAVLMQGTAPVAIALLGLPGGLVVDDLLPPLLVALGQFVDQGVEALAADLAGEASAVVDDDADASTLTS